MEKYTNTEGFSWKIVDFYTQHFSNIYTLYEMLSSTSQDMESHLQRAGKNHAMSNAGIFCHRVLKIKFFLNKRLQLGLIGWLTL